MDTHYGHAVWEDEDGEAYYMAGHVSTRRAIAAANRYARLRKGLINLYDFHGAVLTDPGVYHVWWKPAPYYEEGVMAPAEPDDEGAEPLKAVWP
jgi:hypothetical protein